jgi:hypothetical protein
VRLAVACCIVLAACSGEHSAEAPAEQAVREAMQQAVQDAPPALVPAGDVMPGAPCGTPVVDGNGVGAVRIGMEADSVKAHCVVARDSVELRSEGQPERVLVVTFGSDSATLELDSTHVWRIEILSPRFRTVDSLGVGTPLKALLALPGGVQGLTGEGGLFLLAETHCGLSFQLSASGGAAGDWQRARLRSLPDSTRVTRVLVVGCSPG